MFRFSVRFSAFHRFAAVLALVAMFVPVATGIIHHPAAVQSFIHVCGIDHAGGDKDKAPAHKLPSCPICQSLHLLGGGWVPQPPFVIALVVVGVAVFVSLPRLFFLRFECAPQARPRAPPFFA